MSGQKWGEKFGVIFASWHQQLSLQWSDFVGWYQEGHLAFETGHNIDEGSRLRKPRVHYGVTPKKTGDTENNSIIFKVLNLVLYVTLTKCRFLPKIERLVGITDYKFFLLQQL